MDIAPVFRQRRIALGLTQRQVAAAANVSTRTLSDFESGGNRISLANLNRLLGVVRLTLVLRESALRPTLDQLAERYRGEDETPPMRSRVRRASGA
jgi:transcriptional regulator with XRE-family HTH domain